MRSRPCHAKQSREKHHDYWQSCRARLYHISHPHMRITVTMRSHRFNMRTRALACMSLLLILTSIVSLHAQSDTWKRADGLGPGVVSRIFIDRTDQVYVASGGDLFTSTDRG